MLGYYCDERLPGAKDKVERREDRPRIILPEFAAPPRTLHLWEQDLEEFVNEFCINCTEPPRSFREPARLTFEEFKIKMVRPLHLNDVFKEEEYVDWSEPAGLPWILQGYKTKGDLRRDPKAVSKIKKFAHLLKLGRPVKWRDCLIIRKPGNDEGVAKIEWQYPSEINFVESIFTIPLIQAYEESEISHKMFEVETAAELMMLQEQFSENGYQIKISFVHFSHSIPPWVTLLAFKILLYNLDLTLYSGYGVPSVVNLFRLYQNLHVYFEHTPITTVGGNRYKKYCGISHGSCFTELITPLCKGLIINWLSYKQHGTLPHSYILLDDSILIFSKYSWNFAMCHSDLRAIGMQLDEENCYQRSISSIRKH